MDTREYAHIFKETLRQVCNLLSSDQEVLAAKVVCDTFSSYNASFFSELKGIVGERKSESLSELVLILHRGEDRKSVV